MALGTTYGAKSGLPWWGLFVALLFALGSVPVIGTVCLTVIYAQFWSNKDDV